MRTIFVDTNYWVALINPKDQWHETARESQAEIGVVRLVTTEAVLIEVLNYFAEGRAGLRLAADKLAASLLSDPDVETVPHSHQVFLAALAFLRSAARQGLQPHRLHLDERYAPARHRGCAHARRSFHSGRIPHSAVTGRRLDCLYRVPAMPVSVQRRALALRTSR